MAEEQIVKTEAATEGEKKPVEKTGVAPKAKAKKKKVVRHVPSGRAYIQATYNNTIVTLTDPNGNVLAWSSSGLCGFKGPKKATPYAAGIVVKNAAEKAADYGLQEVNVLVKGVGSGREAAVRALNANGLNVLSIKDMTPIPHNGCRAPKPRRV
ncbi:MAG: 30S ribosomal protein S11 [Patescibacteria group bacterium]